MSDSEEPRTLRLVKPGCGHTEVIRLRSPQAIAHPENVARYHNERFQLCRRCALLAAGADASAVMAAAGWPALTTGTAAQIAWAEQIRAALLECGGLRESDRLQTSATWFIEHRDELGVSPLPRKGRSHERD